MSLLSHSWGTGSGDLVVGHNSMPHLRVQGCTRSSWLRGSQLHLASPGKAPSWGYTTAGCSFLGKGRACRTASKSLGTVGKVKGTSAVYLMTPRLQSRHRWITNWDNPSLGTSTCIGKLEAKGVTCSCCTLLLHPYCGSCRCGFQGEAWGLVSKRHAINICKWCSRTSTGLGMHGVSQGGAGSSC